jgi:hypothetical protein
MDEPTAVPLYSFLAYRRVTIWLFYEVGKIIKFIALSGNYYSQRTILLHLAICKHREIVA